MKLIIPAVWEVVGFVEVEADSIQGAIEKVASNDVDVRLLEGGLRRRVVDESVRLRTTSSSEIAQCNSPKNLIGLSVVIQGSPGKIIAHLEDGRYVVDLTSGITVLKHFNEITFI